MKKYKSNSPMLTNKDANVIGKFIEEKFPNGVEPRTLLEAARDKNSRIHKYFEWDDTAAAEKYRIEQAGNFIRCLVVVVKGEDTRAFQKVYVAKIDKKTYIETAVARQESTLWEQVIERALNELIGWKERYEQYKEFRLVIKSINKLERSLYGKNKKGRTRTKGSDTTTRKTNRKNNDRRDNTITSQSLRA